MTKKKKKKPETKTALHPTPRPWKAVQCRTSERWMIERREGGWKACIAEIGIGYLGGTNAYGGTAEEDARFIEKACNLHDALFESCRELAELVLNYCPDEGRIRSLASVGCPAYGAYQRACDVLDKAGPRKPACWEPAVNGKRWFLVSRDSRGYVEKYHENKNGRLIFFKSHEAAKRKAAKLNAPMT
jgi:hypothetical protein